MDFDRAKIAEELAEISPPDLVSQRPGFGQSSNVYYSSIQIARALADDIFGRGNWRCEVVTSSVDFYASRTEKDVSMHEYDVSMCVRVTLKDETHREDVGGAHVCSANQEEASKNAKAIAKTVAMKRCLRQFGNVLGNCLYYKEYAGFVDRLANK